MARENQSGSRKEKKSKAANASSHRVAIAARFTQFSQVYGQQARSKKIKIYYLRLDFRLKPCIPPVGMSVARILWLAPAVKSFV
jgi:hypothetical protein